jgi:hypothetical protein
MGRVRMDFPIEDNSVSAAGMLHEPDGIILNPHVFGRTSASSADSFLECPFS